MYILNKKKEFNKINKGAITRGKLSEAYYEVVMDTCQEIITENKKKIFYEKASFSQNNFSSLLSRLNPELSKFGQNNSKEFLLYLFQSMHAELNYFGDKK